MPEINEIRKYSDFIKKYIKGKNINSIKILKGRYIKHGPFENYKIINKNLPIKLIDVKTKGKIMYFIFENNLFLLATMGLNKGWVYYNNKKYIFSDVVNDYAKYLSEDKINQSI
jgi:formamidopyrimidine-DNA glycosylase